MIKVEGGKIEPVIGKCWLNAGREKCLPDCGRGFMLSYGVGAKIQLARGDWTCSLSLFRIHVCLWSLELSHFLPLCTVFSHLNFFSCIGSVCIRAKCASTGTREKPLPYSYSSRFYYKTGVHIWTKGKTYQLIDHQNWPTRKPIMLIFTNSWFCSILFPTQLYFNVK